MLSARRRAARVWLAALLGSIAIGSITSGWTGLGCGSPAAPTGNPASAAAPVTPAPERLHALLLNGGGRPGINYHSHLAHLQSLLELLDSAGVPSERIAVFSADGADPSADLAIREGLLPKDFWLLPKTAAQALRPPIELVDSRIDGFALQPAKRASLERWFALEGKRLGAGDALLLYVTDHGNKNAADLGDNTIALWGETLSVRELQALVAKLDPEVRVVMLMSQCFSGAFANLSIPDDPEVLPAGNVCGYFAATPDRMAAGCYPEVSGADAVGHSHRLFAALAKGQRLPEAQREVLVRDATPDVPHASTSVFLERRLRHTAALGGHEFAELVDHFLAEALREPLTWEREIRLLDKVGEAFGFASPRSLASFGAQVTGLRELKRRLDQYAKLWERTLDALRQENLQAFRAAHPEWKRRLSAPALKSLDADGRRSEREALLPRLARFTEQDRTRAARLRELQGKAEQASAASYRAEVRLGIALRLRRLLMELAGRHYISSYASQAERDAFARLEACEDIALAGEPLPELATTPPENEAFPTLAEERERLRAVMPGWLGVRYRPPRAAERKRNAELSGGSVVIEAVLPDSSAARGGIEVADIVLGPPGEPFLERHALREWTMQGELDRPLSLRLLREGEEREVTVLLAAYPLELPALAGPPRVGSAAPALELEFVRGSSPNGSQRAKLLLFWATWCRPCKKSLPELQAFSEQRGVPVIAITDEHPEEIEAFFLEHPESFLSRVVSDPRRAHFQTYGVSGTPTFVLVGEDGVVRHSQVGYGAAGLRIDGWSWNRGSASAP